MTDATATDARDVRDESPSAAMLSVRSGSFDLLHVSGDLDLATAPILRDALDSLVVRGVVGIDLTRLDFMDAAGLRVLCSAADSLGDAGRIVLYDPSPRILLLLEMTGLIGRFDVDVAKQADGAA